jgi:hypothetical protein
MKNVASQIFNHGWARVHAPWLLCDLLNTCYAHWTTFFQSGTKEAFRARLDNGELDGYFPRESEIALGALVADPKEFFHFYRDGKCPEECRASTEAVFEELLMTAVAVFSALGDEVPELRRFSSDIAASNRLVLRITHYFGGSGEIFNAPHEDVDFLTVLPPATDTGLEVADGDDWVPLAVEHGSCVVLCGDMLCEATGGYLQATRHRVRSLSADRYSMSFFMNPSDDVRLSPEQTAGEFLKKRLRNIGLNI